MRKAPVDGQGSRITGSRDPADRSASERALQDFHTRNNQQTQTGLRATAANIEKVQRNQNHELATAGLCPVSSEY